MTQLIKTIGMSAAALITAMAFSGSGNAETVVKAVTVYAGPQSVTPENLIYVTVEATGAAKASLQNMPAVLSYQADGASKTITANLANGLASFQVPAQKSAGHMAFSATVSDVSSNEVNVVVTADHPHIFHLTAKQSEIAGSIALSSKLITDEFGNPISDLSAVIVDLLDQTGLKSRQMVHLSNGRVFLSVKCPASFEGALTVKTSLGKLRHTSPNLSTLCALRED